MKKLCLSILLGAAMASFGLGQEKAKSHAALEAEALKAAHDEISEQKRSFAGAYGRPDAGPSLPPTEDADSFGKNVMFLGSTYAGSVFVRQDCTPDPPLPPFTIGPDDYCVDKAPNTPLLDQSFSNDAWQITIPGKTAKNVFYLLINHTVQAFAINNDPGNATAGYLYSPRVTLISTAFNGPGVIDPSTGLQANGRITVGLPGSTGKTYSLAQGQFQNDLNSYASVNGRGLSRAFFRAIGMPENVIEDIFKKDLTMKFGMNFNIQPKTTSASFFYQLRVLGQ